jgi:hypothetical protein
MKITVTRNFHYGRQRRFLTPGEYRVPADVGQKVADDAIRAGAATRVEPSGPEPRTFRKRGIPANKARGAAPENKALLV